MAAPVIAAFGANAAGSMSAEPAVAVPAGVVDGDLLIAQITACSVANVGGGTPTITPPAGWEPEQSVAIARTATNAGLRSSLYSRIAASEPANYTWTATPQDPAAGVAGKILRITGHRLAGFAHKTDLATDTQSDGTVAAPAVMTEIADCLLLYFAAAVDLAAQTWSTPDATERYDFGAGTTTVLDHTMAEEVIVVPGSSGACNFTRAGSSAVKGAMTLAIAPLAAAVQRTLRGVG